MAQLEFGGNRSGGNLFMILILYLQKNIADKKIAEQDKKSTPVRCQQKKKVLNKPLSLDVL